MDHDIDATVHIADFAIGSRALGPFCLGFVAGYYILSLGYLPDSS
jgi:hypothetical protein